MTFSQKTILFLATGFFSGKIPVAPGTFGTLAAVPFALLYTVFPASFHSIYGVSFILAAVFFADKAAGILREKDPGCIVIDEMAGYVVALSFVPVQVSTLVAGFFIFRFFDIVKPGPVGYFEKNYSGGAGIVLDDVMAGVCTAFVLKLIYLSGAL
ncbi:MAG: phosphatidylglycerophosphatase A [Desulfobacula sp.]|jgi:phosphatidylglycerophosphatase A